jgi:predicted nucleotide-binding protein
LSRIHPEILAKLRKKLVVGQTQAYALVAQRAGQTHLPRHLAALMLAAENGININKRAYASDEERAQLRSGAQPVARMVNASTPMNPPSNARARRGPRRPIESAQASRKSNRVLVVHGRDLVLRDAMFGFLRSLSLQPIEWAAAVRATRRGAPYVGEVLSMMFRQAAAVVVLLSPDDEARLHRRFWKPSDPSFERQLSGQPRPNVLFEAGRAFGSHPDATILVQVGSVRPFSDTLGVPLVHLSDTPECRQDLANRLEGAGCAVHREGTDWLSAGAFGVAVDQVAGTRRRTRAGA